MTYLTTGAAAAALAAIGALAGGPAAAQELTKFRFGTNWVAQAEHGGYYQAMVDGTYKECGLDVEISPGGPQVNGRAMMLAGRLEAYMGGNMLLPWNGVREGVPIVVVAADFQKDPQVLLTHPGTAEKIEDMLDFKMIIGDGGFQSYYRMLMAKYGFTEEQRVPYTFNSAPFIADENSAQQGYVTSEPYAIEKQTGWTPDIWLLADYGFTTYATTVEVTKDTLDSMPDAIQCFVDGSAIGWYNYLYGDNSAALARIKADNPDMTDEQMAYSIEALKKYGIVDSGDALTKGIGAMSDARMEEFYKTMVESGVIEPGLDIKSTYTLQFVNKGVGLDVRKKLTGG